MTNKNTFSTICSITDGQSVENFFNQLQKCHSNYLSIKDDNVIRIFDNFPDNMVFDRQTTDKDSIKYHYHDDSSKYVFFRESSVSDMSIESSEKSCPISPKNNIIKKVTKTKVTIVDRNGESVFYQHDYPVELIEK